MKISPHSKIALFLCFSAMHLGVCLAQESPTPTQPAAETSETPAIVAAASTEEAEALMSKGERKPPINLRGFESRSSVYLPLQLALHAEPVLLEQMQAKQETSDLMFASKAAQTAEMLHAASVGFANAVHSPTGNALFGAALAFDAMDSLFGSKSDRDFLREQYQSFRYPSLHLVSLKKPQADIDPVATLKQHFDEAVKVLADTDLQCEPQQLKTKGFFSDKQFPRGYYAPGNIHHRDYICGYPSPMEIGGYRQEVEKRRVEAIIFPTSKTPTAYDGASMASITLNNLANTKGIRRVLDPQDQRNEEELPKLAFERLKGKISSDWFAIYTVPSDDKKRHVVVVQGEQQTELVLPEIR